MKDAVLLLAFATLLLSNSDCKNKKNEVYEGKLEVKGMCMNYTISVKGIVDTAMIAPEWKDESSGKMYKNVFRLGSPCTFPNDIAEGDTFYFTIDNTSQPQCAVCMAYYPTPKKSLAIKIVKR